MPTILEQRSLFSRQTYTLDYNGVMIHRSGVNHDLEEFIYYENIPATRYFSRRFRPITILVGFILAFVSCFGSLPLLSVGLGHLFDNLFIILLPITAASILWFARQEYLGYGIPGNGFTLDANKPSRAVVRSFLQELHARKVAYLREVYLDHMDVTPTEAALRRLIWLKDLGTLSAEEFNERRRELGSEKSPSAGNFGFRR
jgi:hypothetical protein